MYAGELIAETGNAGPCIPPHLHFEMQRRTSKVVLNNSPTPLSLLFVPVDPYGWSPLGSITADPYPLIPENAGGRRSKHPPVVESPGEQNITIVDKEECSAIVK